MNIPFLILYISCFVFSLSLFFAIRSRFITNAIFLCLALFLGAAILKDYVSLPANHISNMSVDKGALVSLFGVVDNDPVYSDRKTSFVMNASFIEFQGLRRKTCGRVLVNDFGKKEFNYGEGLILEGRLYRPIDFKGEGRQSVFSYREYLRHQGIYNIFSVTVNSSIKSIAYRRANPIKKFAFNIKHKLRKVIFSNLTSQQAILLSAILLGERQNMPAYINDYFIQTGTAHILAISGLHVGIVAFIILVFLKALGVKRKPRYILVIIFLVIYCVLTGARASVIRATVMAIILLFGYIIDREINIYNSLSLAALIILFVNPWQLFEVGFQLSFLSVIFIVALAPRIGGFILKAKERKPLFLNFLIKSLSVSLSAWIGTALPIAYYFRIVSPVTILANLIIVPYMSLVIASGMALALGGAIFPFLAPIIGASTNAILVILILIAKALAKIPLAYFYLS